MGIQYPHLATSVTCWC